MQENSTTLPSPISLAGWFSFKTLANHTLVCKRRFISEVSFTASELSFHCFCYRYGNATCIYMKGSIRVLLNILFNMPNFSRYALSFLSGILRKQL
ncbi:hypothetical protein CMV_023444 [Castanea mollissima]|uniref:Uncharacterized protein n=1 Tax=Castanea mollissima TaxID=60419 RepID=A0A8J4QPX7_9ROSI|nr:hypothetical protein CMV_023444 [Castanea mollissima]